MFIETSRFPVCWEFLMYWNELPPPIERKIPNRHIFIALAVILGVFCLVVLVVALNTHQEEASVAATPEMESTDDPIPQVTEVVISPEQEAYEFIYDISVPTGVPAIYVNETTFDNACIRLYVNPDTPFHDANIKYLAAEFAVQAFHEGTYRSSEVEGVPFETFVEAIDASWCRTIRNFS